MFLTFDFSDSSLIVRLSDIILVTYEGGPVPAGPSGAGGPVPAGPSGAGGPSEGILSFSLLTMEAPLEVSHMNPLDADAIFEKIRKYTPCWEFQNGNCRRLIPLSMTRNVQFDGRVILLTCGVDNGNSQRVVTISLQNDCLESTRELYVNIRRCLHAI